MPNTESLFVQLLPDAAVRRCCLEQIARSILLAHENQPDCWSLTADTKRVRLNVGKIEVLAVFPERLHLVVFQANGPTQYKNVPHSALLDFDASAIAAALPLHASSHEKLVQRAAKTARSSPWARAHEPALVSWIGRQLGKTLPGGENGSLRVRWDEPGLRNFEDILPLEWFAFEGQRTGVMHRVVRKGYAGSWAQCDVVVKALSAELDYTPYRKVNRENGMLVGTARLRFTNSDRNALQLTAAWKGDNESAFTECKLLPRLFDLPPAPPYVPPHQSACKKLRPVRERPGQREFRRNLSTVYEGRCCVTGCAITQALDGAHIDGYRNAASDTVRNGLLLRKDIHCLFDAGMIGIEPKTHRIHLAALLKADPMYGALHLQKLRPPVQPSHGPDQAALLPAWNLFQKRHGAS